MNTSNIVIEHAWGWNQQEVRQKMFEEEIIRKYGKHDPLEPPKKERGDIYIILGTIIGAIIGATVGYFIKNHIRRKPS